MRMGSPGSASLSRTMTSSSTKRPQSRRPGRPGSGLAARSTTPQWWRSGRVSHACGNFDILLEPLPTYFSAPYHPRAPWYTHTLPHAHAYLMMIGACHPMYVMAVLCCGCAVAVLWLCCGCAVAVLWLCYDCAVTDRCLPWEIL